RENINCADNQWNDGERDQRQPPIQPQHDDEWCDECDCRSKDVGETFVVDRLDRLRIVSDAETGIRRPARVVIFERERLEIGVKIGAQFKERLQPNFHEEVICGPIYNSPKELNRDKCKAEQGNPGAPIRVNRWAGSQKIVNDDLERPRLEQVQADSEKREKEPENRLSQEWSVVAENASIDPHVEISGCRFQISD